MRIPLSWLREYAPTVRSPEDLSELLIWKGIHVEGILRPWDGLDGVIAARVLDVRDHPNSETLCLARIHTGAHEQEVVVGVRNFGAGDLVPFAPPGARVPVFPEPLQAREIRGVISEGMLCSARELAISQDHSGIAILDEVDLQPGSDVKTVLGLSDAVLDIEVEPNRPDFLSIYGVAREVAANDGVPLAPIDARLEEGTELAADVATVDIADLDRCPNYLARVIRGVRIAPSPLRVQARLTACGMRPLANVVDVTNYVMLELGQPLHAFDLARLAGPGIVVRRASSSERLVTLDGVERELSEDDLVIADLERGVAIAGVMGSAPAEVSEETKDVLLESAHFARSGVLRTARRLALHTEASHRFERGVDPESLALAAARAAKLIVAWAGGTALAGVAEAGGVPPRRWVSMRPTRASALAGYPVTAEETAEVFDRLGMVNRVAFPVVEVEVPGYRVDIEHEVDLIEEVLRIQGYDRVGSTLPRSPHRGGLPAGYSLVSTVRDVLARAGLREVRPVPFVSAEDLAITGDTDAIAIANPLRAEEGFLRTRLTPGLLHALARNQANGVRSASIFEVGTVFRAGDPVEERRKVAFALSGPAGEGWTAERRDLDALDARGALEALLSELRVGDWSVVPSPAGPFHPGRSAWVSIEGERVGVLGEIQPRVARALDLAGRVSVCELEFDALAAAASKEFTFRDVPRFPPVRRDLAFMVPRDAPAGAVGAALQEAGGELLDRCVLFDVFEGGTLDEDTKSLAFSLEFRAPDRTLTDDEAEAAVARIVARLRADFGARLRAG